MKKFTVEVEVAQSLVFSISAKSEDEAREKVMSGNTTKKELIEKYEEIQGCRILK